MNNARYKKRQRTNAIGLTWIGSLLLLLAALALLLTVENTFNQIWQVRRNRPLIKRVLLYLLVLAAGPPVLGLSLWAWSSVLGASLGLLATLPPALTFVLGLGPALLVLALLTGLFYVVPNTGVRFGDAIVGALLASVALELGKRGFAAYLVKLPNYRALYGSFAVLPLFMLWVYFSWLVTLIAALIAANLGRTRRPPPRRI